MTRLNYKRRLPDWVAEMYWKLSRFVEKLSEEYGISYELVYDSRTIKESVSTIIHQLERIHAYKKEVKRPKKKEE